jgi:catechol 2,3-dioxygenase-like lactoylglutathione lyase family enzyme
VKEGALSSYLRHIAMVVPDLREAEEYYRTLFGMELIGREAELEDGQWYTLPRNKDWDDAESAGIEIGMLALRTGDIVLAFFPGPESPGQVYAIGLAMDRQQVAGVRNRLPAEAEVLMDHPEQFNFRDRYGISWQLVPPGQEFLMNGDASGRWLQL